MSKLKTQLQRYKLTGHAVGGCDYCSLEPDDLGEWVRDADVLDLQSERNELRVMLQRVLDTGEDEARFAIDPTDKWVPREQQRRWVKAMEDASAAEHDARALLERLK